MDIALGPPLVPAVASAIDDYRPRRAVDEAIVHFARTAVAGVRPQNPARAKALVGACVHLGCFGVSVGLDPSCEVLFQPSVIERFIVGGAASLSAPTKRTVRANVRFVASRLGRRGPLPVRLP